MSSTDLHRDRGIVDCSPGIGGQISVLKPPEFDPRDRRADGEDTEASAAAAARSSSETSSIGKNSDASLDGDDCEEENEVQSSYRGPLDMMDALEEVLPCRRGISNFYQGKSKSYTSLADAASSDIKEIVKPENAYSRRRRNLLAFHQNWDKSWNSALRSNAAGGISKRPLSSSKSTLALAMAMSSSESYSSTSEDSCSSLVSLPRSPPPLPPLHPQGRSSLGHISSPRWRSYSVADLQHCSNPLARVRFKDPIDEKADQKELT